MVSFFDVTNRFLTNFACFSIPDKWKFAFSLWAYNLLQAKFKFSFYQALLWWKQIKCIHVKIESRCKLRNKLIEKLVFCRALQKELHPSSVIPDLRVFMVSHPSTRYFNTNSKLIEYKKFALLCIFAITYLQFKTWKNSLYILIREGN